MSQFVRESEDDRNEESAKCHRRQAWFCLRVKFQNHDIGWENKIGREGDVDNAEFTLLVLGCSKHGAHRWYKA